MWVTVVRHGEAGYASDDRSRTLTEGGRRDVAVAAACLADFSEQRQAPPSIIVHSPYTRTVETALLLAERFGDTPLIEDAALTPGGAIEAVEGLLDRFAEASPSQSHSHVVLVSHQPLVSHLTAHFLGQAHPVPSMLPAALTTFSLAPVGAGLGRLLCWAAPPNYALNLQ